MDVVIVSFDDNNVVGVLQVMMVIVVVIIVMIVVVMVVAVARIQGAAVESDMTICPVDVDARARPAFFLCQWLYCRQRRAMLMRVLRIGALRQKRR